MIALIGIISFFGLSIGIIKAIINVIRRKPVKPIGILTSFIVFTICMVITPSVDNDKPIDNNPPIKIENHITLEEDTSRVEEILIIEEANQQEEIQKTIVYDKLQNLFLLLSFNTDEDDLIKWIKDNGLECIAQKYNGTPKHMTYKIAYKHDVALHKHAESGDYISVRFSLEDGSFMFAEYFNANVFKTALLYNYGTYWDFREEKGNNRYSGYYHYKPGDSEDGIIMEYDNGRSKETGYHRANNAEEALLCILSN